MNLKMFPHLHTVVRLFLHMFWTQSDSNMCRNKFSKKEAESEPIDIPTVCWSILLPNVKKLLFWRNLILSLSLFFWKTTWTLIFLYRPVLLFLINFSVYFITSAGLGIRVLSSSPVGHWINTRGVDSACHPSEVGEMSTSCTGPGVCPG